MKPLNRWDPSRALLAAGVLSVSLACGGSSNTQGRRNAAGQSAPCPTATQPLTTDEIAAIQFMREEEKLARDVYQELGAFWGAQAGNVPVVTLMGSIGQAEQQHMDRLKAVLTCNNLPDPVDAAGTRGVFKNAELGLLFTELVRRGKSSQNEALKVGALIEETDISDLRKALAVVDAAAIDLVFDHLSCGSQNHLRAFVGQLKKVDEPYIAQVLAQGELDAITGSPTEPCGRP